MWPTLAAVLTLTLKPAALAFSQKAMSSPFEVLVVNGCSSASMHRLADQDEAEADRVHVDHRVLRVGHHPPSGRPFGMRWYMHGAVGGWRRWK